MSHQTEETEKASPPANASGLPEPPLSQSILQLKMLQARQRRMAAEKIRRLLEAVPRAPR